MQLGIRDVAGVVLRLADPVDRDPVAGLHARGDQQRSLNVLRRGDAAKQRRAERHRLQRPFARALRACAKYLGTPCLAPVAGDPLAALVEARLTSAGQRGLNARATQTALLARAHLIKMPVPLLVPNHTVSGANSCAWNGSQPTTVRNQSGMNHSGTSAGSATG